MLALLPLLLLAPSPEAPAQDPETFHKDLDRVEREMDKGNWKQASDRLLQLLDANTQAEYVYLEKTRILQDMERIALFLEYEAPSADDVLAGDVKKYDLEKGKLEVVFTGTDFSDWIKSGDAYTFPATLTGPYTLEMTGETYPTSDPISLVIGWNTEHSWAVSFGDGGHKPTITWMKDRGGYEYLETSEKQPLKMGHPFRLLVEVKKSKVTVKTNKKKLMSIKRPSGDYGRIGFYGIPDYEFESIQLHFKGEIEPSWVAGKIDAVMQERRTEFEHFYDPEKLLPEWLFEDAPVAEEASGGGGLRARAGGGFSKTRAVEKDFADYPGVKMPRAGTEAFYRLQRSIGAEEQTMANAMADIQSAFQDEELSEPAADHLRLETAFFFGHIEEAVAAADRVVEAHPEHQPSVLWLGRLLARMQEFDRSREVLEQAHQRWPGSSRVMEALVDTEVFAHKLKHARELVRDARADGLLADGGQDLQDMLEKAISGPHWPKTYSFQSRHYDIQSDISEDICKEASHLLESAYNSYSVHLKRIRGLEKEKFRVFLFSGEASYKRYALESLDSDPESTAGLFSPYLKQLLIWNVPKREMMMRTIVHEGFHQYLDMVAPVAPRWFNEGMAEYVELYETVNGKFTEGQVNQYHLELLSRKSVPLGHFLEMPDAYFYRGDVGLHYAQGWAFIHFLRNSGREEQKMFDALFKGFAASPSSAKVMEDVFGDVDMEDLEERFRVHQRKHRVR